MNYQRINLKDYYKLANNAVLEIMVPEITDRVPRDKSPLALICPGGGYAFLSNREKDPIALAFMKEGYVAATLSYTVHDEEHKNIDLYPLIYLQLMAAIDYLRKNAELYSINIDQIVLVGFSAGGHLAASYSYLFDDNELLSQLNLFNAYLRPNYLVLGYPVITLKEKTHGGTRGNITNNNQELIKKLSIEDHLRKDYPVTFVWNTLEDQSVPPINTNLIYDGLMKMGVKAKMIQYEHGWHGLSLVDKNTILDSTERNKYKDVSKWFNEMINYLETEMNK